MNNGSKSFRSSLGGYNREDVNAYIKATDLRHAEEVEELKRALETAKAECTRLSAAADTALEERNAAREQSRADGIALTEVARVKDQEIAALTNKLNLLKAETEAQSDVISSLRDEKAQLAGQLEEASSAAAAAVKEVEDKLKNLRSEHTAQQETLTALQAENNSLTAALNQSAAEAAVLHEESDRRAEVEAQLAEALRELEEKNAQIAEIIASREKSLGDVTERGSDAYKLEMYDKVSSQLGDILIGANRNADEIIAAARAEAEKIRMDTDIECEQKRADCDESVMKTKTEVEEEAAYIRERLSAAASDLLGTVSVDLHNSMENCIRELSACVEDMQYEIRSVLSRLTSRSAEMNDRIDYYQTCVSDGVLEKLAKMDEKYGIHPMTAGNGEDHV